MQNSVSYTLKVNDFVDGQSLSRFNYSLLFWSFLAMFADGFDLNSLGFAAPFLVQEWGIERAAMGPVLSANLAGIFLGAPLLGWLGDKYGRRPLIIGATLLYGVMTLLMAWTHTMTEMIFLRFIAGFGLGGLMPNTISLNSELSPKKYRSTLIVLMFMGITSGSAALGLIAAYFISDFGWPILFHLGGILPLAVAFGMYFFLPESIKFLATKPERHKDLLKLAKKMRPDFKLHDNLQFENPLIISHSGTSQKSQPGLGVLLSNGLHIITPLLWLCYCVALMANYFLNNLIPLIYDTYGMPAQEAAIIATWYHVGGTLGGLVVAACLDRMGFVIVALLFAISVPLIATLGLDLSFTALGLVSALVGIGILGAQFGNNTVAGLLYPTSIRGRGVGTALSIGRFGSILGPTLGALLLGMKLDLSSVFFYAAIPVLVGLLAALLLTRLCYVRFHSFQIDDTPVDN